MDESLLIENAKCWGLIGACTQNGIPLSTGLALAEAECRNDKLRPLFAETIGELERTYTLPASWHPELIPQSTAALVAIGWQGGLLELTLRTARSLLLARIAFSRGAGGAEQQEGLIAFYLQELLKCACTGPGALQITRDELKLPISPTLENLLNEAERTGDFTLLNPLAEKRRQDAPKAATDERSLYYAKVTGSLREGKGLLTAFEDGIAAIPPSDFQKRWTKIVSDLEANKDPDEILKSSGLSPLEIHFVLTGFITGNLEAVLENLGPELAQL